MITNLELNIVRLFFEVWSNCWTD